jgi:hypothetical protein
MGIKDIYGSDYNPKMVEASNVNLFNLKSENNFKFKVELFDARDM